MLNKDGMEYLVGLGEKKPEIIEVDGFKFSNQRLSLVSEPQATAIETNSLSSIVEFVNSNHSDLNQEELIIHVKSPSRVFLYGALDKNRERECFMICKAILPDNISYDSFLNTERFNIMLQSAFVDAGNRAALLKVTGCVKEENVKEVGDDGVSQGVTIKTGVASVNTVVVPNPVILTPYRTFQEVEQVESKFIFRMKSGPVAAIFEADGSMWRGIAIERIKEYLKSNVSENIKILG